ncbi:unnamed protein product [Cochlearia groenlandica]
MGIQTRSTDYSDRENWNRIFKNSVKIILLKEEQIQTLLKNQKVLEDAIKTQHKQWVSESENYKYHLNLMKNEIETLKLMSVVETAKSDLLFGLKERELFLCKSKLEHSQDELNEFKAWFEHLNTLYNNEGRCNFGDEDDCKAMELKISKMKLEFEKLAYGKRCESSKVLGETAIGFAWSQFKNIESGFTQKLMKKDKEIKQLQKSNEEKDKIISKLKAKVDEIDGNASEKRSLRRSPRLISMLNSTLKA